MTESDKRLIGWLSAQAHKAATWPERVAYNNVIKHIEATYENNR